MSYSEIVKTLPLVPACPYCDLNGTPWPGCEHQLLTENHAELSVIRAVAQGIIDAGLPPFPARVGDEVTTTWGCRGNKQKLVRLAVITRINVVLRRHPQSMWYRPQLEYVADEVGGRVGGYRSMVLTDFDNWTASPGYDGLYDFRLEWRSPITGETVNAFPR